MMTIAAMMFCETYVFHNVQINSYFLLPSPKKLHIIMTSFLDGALDCKLYSNDKEI